MLLIGSINQPNISRQMADKQCTVINECQLRLYAYTYVNIGY